MDFKNKIDEAKKMGKNKAEEITDNGDKVKEDIDNLITRAEEGITQSSEYANSILPDLRSMAGFKDSGYGTYRDGGEEEQFKLNELVNKYWEGFSERLRNEIDDD